MSNGDWIKLYVPQGLIIALILGGAGYAWKVGKATEQNRAAIESKAEADDVKDIKNRQDQIAEGVNWIGQALEKIAEEQNLRLPPRPIVTEDAP